MENKTLINFHRTAQFESKPDFGEKIGNIGLGLLRIGFGKTVKVEKLSDEGNIFTIKPHSTLAKVAAVAFFILALPITALLAGVGCIGVACSNSHGQIFDMYSQEKAATAIQKHIRRHLVRNDINDIAATAIQKHIRRDLVRNDIAATAIQKHIRRDLVRNDVAATAIQKHIRRDLVRNDVAATAIQKHIRGYLARPLLPLHLFDQYHAQCQIASGPASSTMPKAEAGKTTVYLPPELPQVVLKRSGKENAVERFHKMQTVRNILDSQGSSKLVIPKASLCGDFLVEERLPINPNDFHNMGLYLSQPQLFDEAVREMTRLFSEIYLTDLVNRSYSIWANIVGDYVRYDNLPLYIDERNGKKEGKIGLIDLEHLHTTPSPQALETLVRIFPLHLDVIKEEANRLGMEDDDEHLEYCAEKGKKYLNVGFANHLEWLRQKGISSDVALQGFKISSARENELTDIVEKELLKLNQGINDLFQRQKWSSYTPAKDFFKKDPEQLAKKLALSFTPMIIAAINTQINEKQQQQLSKLSGKPMTESQLVRLRSLFLTRSTLHQEVQSWIKNNRDIIEFDSENLEHGAPDTAEQLVHVVIEELVKGGELFSFDPGYITGNYKLCWLRY